MSTVAVETPVTRERKRLPTVERQEAIVAAVLGLAAEIDSARITTQAIADRVGITHGALFRHFSDKEAIWAAVFAWLPVALGKALEGPFRDGRSPLDTLERVFFAHVAFIAVHPGVPRLLFHELQNPVASEARMHLRETVARYRKRLTALFEAAKAAEELPATLDAEAAAILFIGTIHGLVLQDTLFADAGNLSARARRLFPLLVGGFRGSIQ